MSMWLKDLPLWVSAGIASLALIATSIMAIASTRQAKHSSEQIEHRNKREKQEQASKVAAWISVHLDEASGLPYVDLHYVNSSPIPAYNFAATLESCGTRRMKKRILEPTDGVQTVRFNAASNLLAEEVKRKMSSYQSLPVGSDYSEALHRESDSLAHSVQQTGLSVQFKDAYGVIWRRSADGLLDDVDIDYDRGWKATFLREQVMAESLIPEGEKEIIFDVLATGSESPQRSEELPNMAKLEKDTESKSGTTTG